MPITRVCPSLIPPHPHTLLHMNLDKTKARATNRNELVERTRDRMILEHMDLQITVINLENPQGWKESA